MPSSQSGYGAPKGTPAQGSGGNALSFRPASATQEVNEEKKKLAPSPIKSYQEIGEGVVVVDIRHGGGRSGRRWRARCMGKCDRAHCSVRCSNVET